MKITWMVDSYGRESLHENGPKKAQESYLGHIMRMDDDWYFVQSGVQKPHGPYGSLYLARRAAVHIVNGEHV